MNTNVRILVVAAAVCGLLGAGFPLSAADTIPELGRPTASAGSEGVTLRVPTDSVLDVVHYSPQPGVWVVEMPEARWDGGSSVSSWPDLGIDRAELEHVDAFGKRLSRLTLWLSQPGRIVPTATAAGLELRVEPLESVAIQPDAVHEETVAPDEVPLAQEPVVPPPTAATVDASDESGAGSPASLVDVQPIQNGEGVSILLRGDRSMAGRAFVLPDPKRLVVDLPGVINRVERHLFPVNTSLVRRVRVAQYRAVPEPITRVVVDLESDADYSIEGRPDGAVVHVGTVSDRAPHMAAAATVAEDGPETPSATIEIARSVVPEPDDPPAALDVAAAVDRRDETRTDERPPIVVPTTPSTDAIESTTPTDLSTDRKERDPWVADPSQLIEKAPAAQVVAAQAREGFETTEVSNEEQQFTGEPITLKLKDADIKDVLRTFATLTGLNIVLDPGASGSVTVELHDVPWDQALDLILRINGLDYVLENNVMRVGQIGKLQAERKAKADYFAQQAQAQPLKTVIKPLSYAKAGEMKTLIVGVSAGASSGGPSGGGFLLSSRGTLVVDERTNQLIIRDTIDRVEGILRLIEQLDQPTPQVVIEGRIVETTRTFSRSIGIVWGYTSVQDAEHGNTTGLNFPNSISTEGRVGLGRGGANGQIGFTFADILNTFNLDFTLSAAEQSGDARVVSSPRITTQNLKKATIRSGLQIPIQTQANNTVTVQYVDATLKLDVTPQITDAGTINLEIDIRKQQPLQAGQVTGGTNAPILTRDAQTELLVRDGGTTVIGGIYQIDSQTSEDRVPGLHKIPILGHLFKNKGTVLNHDELLIFITPRIVKY